MIYQYNANILVKTYDIFNIGNLENKIPEMYVTTNLTAIFELLDSLYRIFFDSNGK